MPPLSVFQDMLARTNLSHGLILLFALKNKGTALWKLRVPLNLRNYNGSYLIKSKIYVFVVPPLSTKLRIVMLLKEGDGNPSPKIFKTTIIASNLLATLSLKTLLVMLAALDLDHALNLSLALLLLILIALSL